MQQKIMHKLNLWIDCRYQIFDPYDIKITSDVWINVNSIEITKGGHSQTTKKKTKKRQSRIFGSFNQQKS